MKKKDKKFKNLKDRFSANAKIKAGKALDDKELELKGRLEKKKVDMKESAEDKKEALKEKFEERIDDIKESAEDKKDEVLDKINRRLAGSDEG